MGFFALRKSTETQARGRISGEIRVPAGYTARAYYCWFINIATSQMHTFSPALLLMNIDVVNHRSRYYHHHHHSNITGCAVAQQCYNGDVSFLWEKWIFWPPVKSKPLNRLTHNLSGLIISTRGTFVPNLVKIRSRGTSG